MTTTEPETEPRADWARDVIEVELERAGDAGLDKETLQRGLGIGTEDLRAALAAMTEDGALRVDGDRYVLLDDELAVGQRPDAEEDLGSVPGAATGEAETDEADEPGPPPAVEGVGPVEGHYRARLMIDVTYQLVDPGQGDGGAVRDAATLLELAQRGIAAEFPDLGLSGAVTSVDAFDSPRHIYP